MPTSERRREPRLEVLGLWGTTGPGGETRIVDVAPHGVGIETTVQPHIGRCCTVLVSVGDETASLRGRVAWARLSRCEAREDGSRPVYRAGLLLDGSSVLSDGLLHRLAEEYALLVPPTAMAGVIPPQETLHLSISRAFPFELLRVGPRGVRIATPLECAARGEICLELVLNRAPRAARGRVVRSVHRRDGRELEVEISGDAQLRRELASLARAAGPEGPWAAAVRASVGPERP